MSTRRIPWHITLFTAALWLAGLSAHTRDTAAEDAVKGWTCLFESHEFINPLDQLPPDAPLVYANFWQNHKAVIDDAQAYIKNEESSHTPPSPPHEFIDIFANVQGAAVLESEAGLHAIKYDVYIKEKSTDWDCAYVLLYDKSDKRTKVIISRNHHPSRGFGLIKPGPQLGTWSCGSVALSMLHLSYDIAANTFKYMANHDVPLCSVREPYFTRGPILGMEAAVAHPI